MGIIENPEIESIVKKLGIDSDLLEILSPKDIEDFVKMENNRKIINNSTKNYYKRKADCRNKNLDPKSAKGKGYITETLVKKFLGIEDCFDLADNFNNPGYDMIENDDWGIIDVKGSSLSYSGGLLYWCFYIGKNTKPDFFFNVGYDEYMKHVEGFYIVPNEDYVSKLGSIWTPYRGNSKWNIFREGEKEVRKLDRPFHTLKLEDCPVLRPY